MPAQLLKHLTLCVAVLNTTPQNAGIPTLPLPFSFDKVDIEKSCPLTLSDTSYDAIHAFLMSPAQRSAGFNNHPFLHSNLLKMTYAIHFEHSSHELSEEFSFPRTAQTRRAWVIELQCDSACSGIPLCLFVRQPPGWRGL